MNLPKNDNSDIIEEAGLMHFYRSVETEDSINNNTNVMKEHLKSFLVTFLVAVAMVLVANIDNITLATFENGAIYGVLFASLRAGVKAVLELVISIYSSR